MDAAVVLETIASQLTTVADGLVGAELVNHVVKINTLDHEVRMLQIRTAFSEKDLVNAQIEAVKRTLVVRNFPEWATAADRELTVAEALKENNLGHGGMFRSSGPLLARGQGRGQNDKVDVAVKRVMEHADFASKFKHPVKFNGTDFIEQRLTTEQQLAEVTRSASQQMHVFLERYGSLLCAEDLRALAGCPAAETAEAVDPMSCCRAFLEPMIVLIGVAVSSCQD
ncbi:unnamed protein product [Symbiodinium sp. CCMP2592]|nr:unnamed protein product [Symbiodinium sp. CCMP2592]